MNAMLEKGFAFGRHLDDGRAYYDSIFQRTSQASGLSAHLRKTNDKEGIDSQGDRTGGAPRTSKSTGAGSPPQTSTT